MALFETILIIVFVIIIIVLFWAFVNQRSKRIRLERKARGGKNRPILQFPEGDYQAYRIKPLGGDKIKVVVLDRNNEPDVKRFSLNNIFIKEKLQLLQGKRPLKLQVIPDELVRPEERITEQSDQKDWETEAKIERAHHRRQFWEWSEQYAKFLRASRAKSRESDDQ